MNGDATTEEAFRAGWDAAADRAPWLEIESNWLSPDERHQLARAEDFTTWLRERERAKHA